MGAILKIKYKTLRKMKGSLLLLMLFSGLVGNAQDFKVTGIVLDEHNIPIPGVTVNSKENTTGTSTDFDGKYELSVEEGEILVLSYVGYITKKIKVTTTSNFNVVMQPDPADRPEVVVALSCIRRETISVGEAKKSLEGKTKVKEVKGIVIDENNMPLPGATVMVKGTNISTETDFDGVYVIPVKEGERLVISYVGYATQEFTINTLNKINVALEPDIASIKEVVVTCTCCWSPKNYNYGVTHLSFNQNGILEKGKGL